MIKRLFLSLLVALMIFSLAHGQVQPTHALPLVLNQDYRYQVNLYFGSNNQRIVLMLDTCSPVLQIFCSICKANCIPSIQFNVTQSSTYKNISCSQVNNITNMSSANINQCKAQCIGKPGNYTCNFLQDYGSKTLSSFVNLTMVFDQVKMEPSGRSVKTTFGCITNQSNFQMGLWGIAYTPSSQILSSFSAAEPKAMRVFSICTYGVNNTYMYIGGIKTNLHKTKSATAYIDKSYYYWWRFKDGQIGRMTINGTIVRETTVSFGTNGIIIDSGAPYMILTTSVLDNIYKVVSAFCKLNTTNCKPAGAYSIFPYSLNITNLSIFMKIMPTLNIVFGNSTVAIPITSYLSRISLNQYVLYMVSAEKNAFSFSILSASLFYGWDIVFDSTNACVSMFPVTNCKPTARLLQEQERNLFTEQSNSEHILTASPRVQNERISYELMMNGEESLKRLQLKYANMMRMYQQK